MKTDFDHMLTAKEAAKYSTCQKRKIGVCIPVETCEGDEEIVGWNFTIKPCTICSRETCGAVHAEVAAITSGFMIHRSRATKLYIWAEIPCTQCLNYIHRFSFIKTIFCLSPESYSTIYPVIARRTQEIADRRAYAQSMEIDIIELDREEILAYELP